MVHDEIQFALPFGFIGRMSDMRLYVEKLPHPSSIARSGCRKILAAAATSRPSSEHDRLLH